MEIDADKRMEPKPGKGQVKEVVDIRASTGIPSKRPGRRNALASS
jgi:hypothetical protein